MSELKQNKAAIEDEFRKINETNKVIDQKLDAAKASGNTDEYNSLINDLRAMKDRENFLQNSYTKLATQEADLQVADVSKKMDVLRKSVPVPFASPMQSMGMPGATALSTNQQLPKEVDERNRKIVGEIYNLPIGKGGRKAEKIPTSLMAQVQSLYDPTSKSQLLEKTYGKGNVLPVDVGGNTEFFIKSPDGIKTTLDKGIAGLAGIATEAPVVASEIASFLGILGSTKSPALANVGSAAVGGVVGSGIDTALRLSYGLSPDFGGTIARRGTGAIIGAGTGMLTDVAIPAYRAARIPDPFENKFVKILDESANRLRVREEKLAASQGRAPGEINVPVGARLAGQQGVDIQSELAGTYAGSGIATGSRNTQESLLRLSDDIKSNIPVTPSDFSNIAIQQEAKKNALSEQIGVITGRGKRIIDAAFNRQTKGPLSRIDDLGKTLFSSIKDARVQAIENVRAAREEVFSLADQAGFSMTPEEMLDKVSEISRQANESGALNTSAVDIVSNRLRTRRDAPILLERARQQADDYSSFGSSVPQDLLKRIDDLESISGPLTAIDFDNFVREFREARPDNVSSGATKDVFGGKIASGLSNYRKQVFDSLETTLPDGSKANVGTLFEKYSDEVNTRQKYNENLLGSILKEAGGEQSKNSRAIVNSVLKEPDTTRKVIQSLRELEASDPSKAGQADKILELLQLQYMNDIGIGAGGASKVKIDDGFLDALFGREAAAQKRSIEELNRNLGNIGAFDFSIDDIKRMGQPLSEQERRALAKNITQKAKLQKEEAALANSTILKLAKKGDYKNIDPDALSSVLLSKDSTINDVVNAMTELSKLSPEARNLFKGDFKRNLFNKYPHGETTVNAPFMPLFETKKFLLDYEIAPGATSQLGKKLEVILGKEEAEGIADIARLSNANMITDVTAQGFVPRFTATNNGVILGIPFGQLATSVRNRYVTAMLSSGSQLNTLKRALAKNAMPGAVNKAYNDMAKEMFLTKTGLEALAHQASSDPEFSAELTNMAKQFKENQGINLAADMIKMERAKEK
jgi:DNA-binding transcriptional regulator YhcF (GntR family)